MKKTVFIVLFFLVAGLNANITKAQSLVLTKPNPIPSFDFVMTGQACFEEYESSGNIKEKRDLNVTVSTTSHNPAKYYDATVYLIKNRGAKILGPYQLSFGETLTVTVTGSKWGAVIYSDKVISVDIWFSE